VETAVIPGSGVASVNDDGSFHLLSFGLVGGAFGPFTGTLADIYGSAGPVRLTGVGNLSGSFSGLSGGSSAAGVMGLSGLAKLCLIPDPGCTYLLIPMPLSPTPALGAGLGIGGTNFATGWSIFVTQQHMGWAVSPAPITLHRDSTTVATETPSAGFVHGPASQTSSAAQPSGVVQLVTVTKVFTSLTNAFPELPIFATLNLHFVPEPSTLLLSAAGIVGLAVASRMRRTRA